jgi:trans-aconitate 2-methyltransferase
VSAMGPTPDHPGQPREWDAAEYHRLGNPQLEWALGVLARLELVGDETVLDAGCGTGRVTERLLERLPRGRVVALDASRNMLELARAYLEPRFGRRVSFVEADLQDLRLESRVDVIFSAATLHWVLDHDRLFAGLYAALVPGGRLHAQCGGGPNVKRIRDRADGILTQAPFAPHFRSWRPSWFFAGPEDTEARMRRAGFVEVSTGLEPIPALLPNAEDYRAFLESVVCPSYLEVLPEPLQERFLDAMVEAGAKDAPPWSLDYVRLNLAGRRPKEEP